MTFAIGDHVKPRPEWLPCHCRPQRDLVPSGRVIKIERRGNDHVLYLDGEDRRPFAAEVFERSESA